MSNWEIKKYKELNEAQKEKSIQILIDGFKHLFTFSKDEAELQQLFADALNSEFIYLCIENEQVLGLMGLATNQLRPVKLNEETCIRTYGKGKGKIICKQMNAIFQSPVVKQDTDLYIDVLATDKEARGKGVASKLMEYAFSLEGYKQYYIEVFSKNVNAKRLYENTGFKVIKKSPISPLLFLGYGYPIKMMK